ncbi:MAG: hypothetical protein AB7N99_01145 [Simkaniaceae bacterium]
MKWLNEHKLDFNLTSGYFKENLEGTNDLSSEILNIINFQQGNFFTLLSPNSNLMHLSKFKEGGLLPSNPIEQYCIKGKKSSYSNIPTIQTEISDFIFKEMNEKQLNCVFDDVIRSPNDKKPTNLFINYGFTHQNEIYYIIEKNSASPQLIENCLEKSNAFWHSLCILTKTNFSDLNKKMLSQEKLTEICHNTKIIIVGAYDGEGYLFWEKKEPQ